MKKILVVYYSRTGNTKKIAKEIAKNLDADLDEIRDLKNRKGLMAWIASGREARLEKITEIKYKKNPSKYDLVIVGTPVWAWNITPPVRTYLTKNKLKNTAFFCTYGGVPGKTFESMEKLSKKPISKVGLNAKEMKNFKNKIKKFCEELK
jgi:flavodoxin